TYAFSRVCSRDRPHAMFISMIFICTFLTRSICLVPLAKVLPVDRLASLIHEETLETKRMHQLFCGAPNIAAFTISWYNMHIKLEGRKRSIRAERLRKVGGPCSRSSGSWSGALSSVNPITPVDKFLSIGVIDCPGFGWGYTATARFNSRITALQWFILAVMTFLGNSGYIICSL